METTAQELGSRGTVLSCARSHEPLQASAAARARDSHSASLDRDRTSQELDSLAAWRGHSLKCRPAFWVVSEWQSTEGVWVILLQFSFVGI